MDPFAEGKNEVRFFFSSDGGRFYFELTGSTSTTTSDTSLCGIPRRWPTASVGAESFEEGWTYIAQFNKTNITRYHFSDQGEPTDAPLSWYRQVVGTTGEVAIPMEDLEDPDLDKAGTIEVALWVSDITANMVWSVGPANNMVGDIASNLDCSTELAVLDT